MTQAPHLLPGARAGYRIGDAHAGRLDDVRRPDLRLRPVRHGPRHRALQPEGRASPASARTPSPPPPTRRPPPRPRTAAWPRRSSRCRCPSARATRCSSTPTRASGPARPPSRWARCARPSTRRAPSPPATPRRSPTAARRSSSCRRPRPRSWASRPSASWSATARWPAPTPRCCTQPSRAIAQALGKAERRPGRHRPLRDQRGLRRRRPGLGRRARIPEDKVNVNGGAIALGSPRRHVGHPGGAHRPARAAPPRRRPGRGGAVRWRRPGRRAVLSPWASARAEGPGLSAGLSARAERLLRREGRGQETHQPGRAAVHLGPAGRGRSGRSPSAQVGKPRRATRSRPFLSSWPDQTRRPARGRSGCAPPP